MTALACVVVVVAGCLVALRMVLLHLKALRLEVRAQLSSDVEAQLRGALSEHHVRLSKLEMRSVTR